MCRALVTECLELNVFLQKVLRGDTGKLRLKADVETSKFELQKLQFSDWVSLSSLYVSLIYFLDTWDIFICNKHVICF